MGKQRAGRVKLLTVDNERITLSRDSRFEVEGIFTAALRAGIPDAPPLQHATKQLLFLSLSCRIQHQVQDSDLILRDLPECRVGCRDDRKDFGQGDIRHLRAAKLAGNGNTAQTTLGERLDLGPRQLALPVTLGSLFAGHRSQGVRSFKGFIIRTQNVRR